MWTSAPSRGAQPWPGCMGCVHRAQAESVTMTTGTLPSSGVSRAARGSGRHGAQCARSRPQACPGAASLAPTIGSHNGGKCVSDTHPWAQPPSTPHQRPACVQRPLGRHSDGPPWRPLPGRAGDDGVLAARRVEGRPASPPRRAASAGRRALVPLAGHPPTMCSIPVHVPRHTRSAPGRLARPIGAAEAPEDLRGAVQDHRPLPRACRAASRRRTRSPVRRRITAASATSSSGVPVRTSTGRFTSLIVAEARLTATGLAADSRLPDRPPRPAPRAVGPVPSIPDDRLAAPRLTSEAVRRPPLSDGTRRSRPPGRGGVDPVGALPAGRARLPQGRPIPQVVRC